MSQNDLVVRFAGEGGAGMLTIAETLVQAATKSGYHGLTFATFPSQIMGGPTWMQARISSEPVLSSGDTLDVLVECMLVYFFQNRLVPLLHVLLLVLFLD